MTRLLQLERRGRALVSRVLVVQTGDMHRLRCDRLDTPVVLLCGFTAFFWRINCEKDKDRGYVVRNLYLTNALQRIVARVELYRTALISGSSASATTVRESS